MSVSGAQEMPSSVRATDAVLRGLRVVTALLVLAAWSAAAQEQSHTPQASASPVTFVQAGRLLADPATGRIEAEKTLVVQGGRVVAVRDGFVSEAGGSVIDLRTSFVLPGLIDSHVHVLTEAGPGSSLARVTKSSSALVIDGAMHALRTLQAGFTTIADIGADNEAIFALRDGIAAGKVPGPRIVASGSIITPEGGHADVHGYRADVMRLLANPAACSGADDCRRAVRRQVQLGADFIKITATGGVLSNTAAGLDQQFSDAELVAIVETAHGLGRRVTAHAHAVRGINAALRAGVDSIEHGTYLDADSIALFRARDAYLVPTLLAGDYVPKQAARPDSWFSPAMRAKIQEAAPHSQLMGQRARAGGIKIALGTDCGVIPHGSNAQELALMVKAGFTPRQAIVAATVAAADHLARSDDIGTLAPGKSADIIAVHGDPTEEVSELENVHFVMKQGVVYRHL